jgi:Ca-activated chloride channel family protein
VEPAVRLWRLSSTAKYYQGGNVMSTKRFLSTFFLLLVFLFSGMTMVYAQDRVTPEPPVDIPQIWRMGGLEIEYQRVNVTIKDQVATTHIEQLFVNDSDQMLEGTYLFPLPQGASVSQLTMWVNGQAIEAKILEKEEAREIYDAIVRELRDPALLEYVGSNAIQANVFPIPPHEERRVEIEYSQVLPAENGLIHYIYPQSTNLYTNIPLDNQSIRVEVVSDEPIHAIYSPSHPVSINREGEYEAVVGFEADDVTPDVDFELYYTVSPEEIGLNLLSYGEAGEDGFFMLLVAPPVEAQEVVAKDVILVLDTSGSMDGTKMQQAKDAAVYIVEHLNPEDRFNIITFSTGVRRFAPDLLESVEAGNYDNFISSLEAVGGTNISGALLEAAGQVDGARPTTIIFVTDGLATEGITDTGLLLDAVVAALPSQARLFAFGVGNDVDPNLLDNLAQNHRGTTTYVRPGQAVDEAVSGFYAKVSSPVLSDISLDYDGVIVEESYPQTLPDLFAGTQLVVAGRYRDGGPATITLSGEVNGNPQSFTYEDNVFRSSGGDVFIPRLWATRAIGHLLRQIRLHGENDEWVQSVVNLSIRYGIITPYTSYLIEEDDIFSQTGRNAIIEDELQAADGALSSRVVTEVEEAAAQAEMAAAEAPLNMPMPSAVAVPASEEKSRESSEALVQFAGSKTFLLRDGVWMDTAFDEDKHQEIQEIGFATDAYFDLMSAAPELGQYLALGQQVLVIYDNLAYKVVEGEGQPGIILPASQEAGSEDSVNVDEPAGAGVKAELATPEPADTRPATQANLCTTLLAFPMLLGFAGAVNWYGRRRRWSDV